MQKFQADISTEDGEVFVRGLDIWLTEIRHPNGFNRKWVGSFTLRGESRRRIDIMGRYHLQLSDGRTGEFLITRITPDLLQQTDDIEFAVSGGLE